MKVKQLRKRHQQRFVSYRGSSPWAHELSYDYAKSHNKVKQNGPSRR